MPDAAIQYRSRNACLCYIRHDHQTLMLHRTKKPDDPLKGFWIVPGGHFEPGESPEDCARREALEETGLTLNTISLRGIVTFVKPSPPIFDTYTGFLFECFDFSGDLIQCNEGDLAWVDDDHVLGLSIPPADRQFLVWIYEQCPLFSAKFVLEPEHPLEHVYFYE